MVKQYLGLKFFLEISAVFIIFIFCLETHAGLSEAKKEYGKGNYKSALKELEPLANKGDVLSQYMLGVMNENGQGVQKSIAKAAAWYLKAAEGGYAEAQLKAGLMYEAGLGVPRNDDQAAKWYRWSAVQGNAAAQNNLGMMYLIGKGVRQDYQMAAKWFGKAAMQGDINAQLSLGSMYATGQGMPEDLIQADKWFTAAALQGDEHGQQNQKVAESRMTEDQTEEAKTEAMEWFLGHKVLRKQPDIDKKSE